MPFPLSFIFSPYNFLFGAGLAAGWLYDRRQESAAPMSFALGVLIFAGVWIANCVRLTNTDHSYLGYGVGAALILFGLARTEASGAYASPVGWCLLATPPTPSIWSTFRCCRSPRGSRTDASATC